jgi:hypothetical protein
MDLKYLSYFCMKKNRPTPEFDLLYSTKSAHPIMYTCRGKVAEPDGGGEKRWGKGVPCQYQFHFLQSIIGAPNDGGKKL